MDGQQMFRKTFLHAPIGMALLGLDGQVFMANPAMRKIFGFDEDEVIFQSGPELTHPDDRNYSFISDMLNGKIDTYQTIKRYIKKNGIIFSASVHFSLVMDEDNTPLILIVQILVLDEIN